MTNTQTLIDAPHKDLRRARAASVSLIPTTTGSATAIGLIFPELEGKLNGLAVRVPLLNASLTDCVFEVARPTTVEEVNGLLEAAADGPLAGILGYERRPLVSVDFKDDPRSGIVDAPSTMVTDGTQVKILAWYDNEWGYANRLVELARTVADTLPAGEQTAGLRQRRPMASSTAAPAGSSGSARQGDLRNYVLVTGAYWTDTLVDGAIRTLVLFYFDQLGYTPLQVASLFVFYEIAGHRHEPRRRLARGPPRPEDHALHGPGHPGHGALHARLRAAIAAGRPLRDGLPGALGRREGPEQDELQERRQAGRARGRPVLAVPLGRDPDRLEERAEGSRLLPRRPAAHAVRIPDRRAGARGARADRPDRDLDLDTRPPRPPGQDREVQAHVLQQPRGQHPRGRAHLPVRRPRRVVRRRPAVLPLLRTRLELLGGRNPPRRVGDRLRRRPGGRAALRPPPRPRPRRRARRQDRRLAGVRRRAMPRRDGRGARTPASTRRSRSSAA